MNNIFAIVPIEILLDDRLSKTDLRVLIAILSFRSRDTNLCWPSRRQLSERCNGLPECKISVSTTNLVNFGWLIKEGKGGFSAHCKYQFKISESLQEILQNNTKKVTDLVTVTDSVTVTDLVTPTVTDLVTVTVTDSVTRNKQTNKHTNKQIIKENIKESSFSLRERLKNITEQTFNDFVKLRKAKRAPLTLRAIEIIEAEAVKAGISLENALIECCARGWQSFKAEWYKNLNAPNQRASPVIPIDQSGYNKQQTEIARQKLFGITKPEKDVTYG